MRSSTNKSQIAAGYKVALLVACGLFLIDAGLVLHLWPRQAKPAVYLKTLRNNHYQLIVNKKPYVVRGVCYNPIPVGQNYDYDWWADPYKPWMVDGALMKEMKVNTVRIYQTGQDPAAVKQVIRDLYDHFGIRTILGHWLGFWEYPCPFYGDEDFQKRITNEVVSMVREYKDEPGVLGWVLGNENNYSCMGHVNPWTSDEVDKEPDPQKQKLLRAKIYYSFVNSLARQIHAIDRNHPVGLGNGELIMLEEAKKFSPDVDFIACIIYRGKSFGNLFQTLRATFDKPLLFSEIGADSYDAYQQKEDQNMQAFFLESQWRQVFENTANVKGGSGNCIGGVVFEWTDEWWKHNPTDPATWAVHDTESNWSNGSYYFDIKAPNNMNMNEEWFGIVSLSSDEKEFGLDKRVPRKAYYVLRELWKQPYSPKEKGLRTGKKK
jgi:hypothetical protein